MPIDTREELINALNVASEIEHGLLVQYLYTLLTMKRRLDEGLTTRQQKETRAWQSSMLKVAREEMVHLGIVSNLLVSIGARPHLSRPNLPLRTGYYPFPFDLLPFSDTALHRFQVFENPQGAPSPPPPGADLSRTSPVILEGVAPEPIVFSYVGELYGLISQAFDALPEKDLFIGPPSVQLNWEIDATPRPGVTKVVSKLQVQALIAQIVEQGEGTSGDKEGSHFDRFSDIRFDYFNMGRFSAARAVPVNPATRQLPDSNGSATIIRHPLSLKAAETFAIVYGTMLMMLDLAFLLPEANDDQKGALQAAIGQIMSVAVRPLGEIVSELPLDKETDSARAGPTFEIFGDIASSPFAKVRWELLFERLQSSTAACIDLGKELPRAALIGETLGFLLRNLRIATKGAA